MSRNSESQRTQATPHFDGEAESIINGPLRSASIDPFAPFYRKHHPSTESQLLSS
ncbi:hypothetical protein [Schinkia azotoformans]|uniref:hypothetical protein n=1 Tax=Schinkia azotoformans TaxID=1454 RepID=UPI002DBCE085|nr:hypothetical protein [Schinkia azotoformans]MEC1722495.1 hypothetical protein [Schinkia azotoformans]MED4415467.1 hypothetical protein [Schinkia azotoformans]